MVEIDNGCAALHRKLIEHGYEYDSSSAQNKINKPFFLNIGTATQIGFTDLKKQIPLNYVGSPETIFDFHKQHGENLLNISKII